MTFDPFDQSDEEIWPDQQKDNDKNKDNEKDKDSEKDKDNDNWRTPSKNIIESCDFWDTDNISNNWNNNLNIHSDPSLNKEWQGQHSQFLRYN